MDRGKRLQRPASTDPEPGQRLRNLVHNQQRDRDMSTGGGTGRGGGGTGRGGGGGGGGGTGRVGGGSGGGGTGRVGGGGGGGRGSERGSRGGTGRGGGGTGRGGGGGGTGRVGGGGGGGRGSERGSRGGGGRGGGGGGGGGGGTGRVGGGGGGGRGSERGSRGGGGRGGGGGTGRVGGGGGGGRGSERGSRGGGGRGGGGRIGGSGGVNRIVREGEGRVRSEWTGDNWGNQRLDVVRARDGGGEFPRERAGHDGEEAPGRRGRASRGTSRDAAPVVNKLGYKTLEELLEKDPSVVAITLSSSMRLRALLEEKTVRQDLTQLLCQVLRKAFQTRHDRTIVLHLAQAVKDSSFFQTALPLYVTGIMSDHNPARRLQYPLHLDNIISLLTDVVCMFPSSSILSVSMMVAVLKPVVNHLRASGTQIPATVDDNLEKIQGLVDNLQQKAREGTLRSDNYTIIMGNELEAEDFRNMTIYPTPEEFHQDQKPFLRPNITLQHYPSTHIYLDTHFRLLREDFVKPLREGIRQLLESQHDDSGVPLRKRRFEDIRVYYDTRLVAPICTSSGMAYKVQFDPQPLQFVRWENSKRLLYGSLVCLSRDNFETFLFATVCERDPKLLSKGQVQLCFSRESRAELSTINTSHSFLMVESTAYFEAYRYVLQGLQEQDEDSLPFQRYIVDCNPDVHPPVYLTRYARTYDLSCIAAKGHSNLKPFNPLNPDTWPTEEQLGLDESQLQALKLALTKELAIIQGPPGTGKTHVGLKIAQALLKNMMSWSDESPMLVVCYTNHALDQFLEGIHGFLQKGIVRVGGRSSSEVLKRFSLRELSRLPDFRRNLPSHLKRAHSEIYKEMKTAELKIKNQSLRLECSLRGVMNESVLYRYMCERHWISLSQPLMQDGFANVGEKVSMMAEWLGVGTFLFQQTPQQQAAHSNADETEDVQPREEEELLQVDEEAALIQAERILEDTDPWGSDDEQQWMEEKSMAELEDDMLVMNLEESEDKTEQGQGQTQGQGQGQGQGAADDEKWQIQRHQKRKIKQMVKNELKKSSAMSKTEEEGVRNVWDLNVKDRWRLYRLWMQRYQADLREKSLHDEHVFQNAAERLSEIRRREDLCLLRHARVIGMTTTGAAKYRQVLQDLQLRLVIVEEAAEVLEAHTITTLSQDCQHLILIGDHQQLRPSATVFELARNFNLEVSMFERLVNMKFPFVRLNYQHRMRPEIARLLTPHIYSELQNHPSVLEYENIKGVQTNLFFVDHKFSEAEIKDSRSHQNMQEAHFVVALCRYLLCQEYEPSQITILTTYTGQLYCLRKLMPSKEFSGVKVHVVDKYQGEENDIVILSLVRSNDQAKVGFLKISNRVCVALSRAKKGLYCLGNAEMFSQVKLWSGILQTLKENNQLGRALVLSCQNHPETNTAVACFSDFCNVPEGGCNKPCEYRLNCGHVCVRMCHPYDPDHKKYKCNKACTKVLCELGHKCPHLCYEECGDCMVPMEKVIPQCQHNQIMSCHLDPKSFICRVPCEKKLSCGHRCQASCGQACTVKLCKVKVHMTLKCGHIQLEPCYISSDPTRDVPCRSVCNAILKCGHACSGTCHTCHHGRLHRPCLHRCKRVLPCAHQCQVPCTRNCPPCTMPCQNRCVHSKCKKQCGQPCAPCAEPCEWRCAHQTCSKLCHEPCDRPPCQEQCTKTLRCGHPCIGLCGDPCPDKCRVCHHEEVTEIFFGNEQEPDACFVQLEDCKHIIESTAMDLYMGMDEEQEAGLDQRAIRLKECPRCRTPIRRNVRYGTHINRSLQDIEKVKEHISGLQSDIKPKQEELQLFLQEKKNLIAHFPQEYTQIEDVLQKSDLSLQDLWNQEMLISFLESLGQMFQMQVDHPFSLGAELLSSHIEECLQFLLDDSQRFSEQQVEDLKREVKRLSYVADLGVRCMMAKSREPEVTDIGEVKQAWKLLEDPGPFSERAESELKRIFKELETKLPLSGLGITENERVMIIRAMNLNLGHWYKCPNGHIYAIGECGGAMEKLPCPTCGAVIGGANHTLAAGNSVATEMDGALHPAWSEAANRLNFDPRDF